MARYDLATSAPGAKDYVNVRQDTLSVERTVSIDDKASGSTDNSRWMTQADITEFKKEMEIDSKELKEAAIDSGLGYITFEDGENDDHLQNLMAYVNRGKVPEMMVLHGGNALIRLENYFAFWKAQKKETGCKIPEILLGDQGIEEESVFDEVEGLGSIEPVRRQKLVENPMSKEERTHKAQDTYKKVRNYIEKLQAVVIALKTAPTDLAGVLNGMKESSMKKMDIFWASPGGFRIDPVTGHLEMHAKFNFYRNDAASRKVLMSQANIFMTGKDLSNSLVKGLVDKTHALKLAEVDDAYKKFDGFEGFAKLLIEAKEGTFFYFYRVQQTEFQRLKHADGEKKMLLEIKPKQELLKALEHGSSEIEKHEFKFSDETLEKYSSDLIGDTKENLDKWKKPLFSELADKSPGSEERKSILDRARKYVEDMKYRDTYLYFRWNSFISDPGFAEGCTADPLLELLLDPALRSASVKELISVKLVQNAERKALIDITADEKSNCHILTDVDDSKLIEYFQRLIDWQNRKIQMPWEDRPEITGVKAE